MLPDKLLKTEIPQASNNKDILVECARRRLPNVKMSFRWSIQPMLTWMRYIGVHLDQPGIAVSTQSRCLVTLFGLFTFFISICRNGYLFVRLVQYLTDPEIFMTNSKRQAGYATIWNGVIAGFNEIMLVSVSHLFLLSAAATKWTSLVQVLLQMEKDNFFEPRDYKRFRLFFTSGIVWLITVT